MPHQIVDEQAVKRSVNQSTKASAKLEQRVVPVGFVRSARVEEFLRERRHPA